MSNEKIYERPEFDEEIGASEEQVRREPRRNRTAPKKTGKGKKVALTILVLGGLAAGAIFGTKAVHSMQETKRVDMLLSSYVTENYVVLPNEVISDRAYDTTYADGAKVVSRLEDKNIDYININGQFYTKDGIVMTLVTFEVTYEKVVDSLKVSSDGVQFYMPPMGYGIHDRAAWVGQDSSKLEKITRTVALPADYPIDAVSFPGALEWHIVGEPAIITTLPYSVINDSTLICDVPDNATLNENNECVGTLDLAPKKR